MADHAALSGREDGIACVTLEASSGVPITEVDTRVEKLDEVEDVALVFALRITPATARG
jgi:hypothetical protein